MKSLSHKQYSVLGRAALLLATVIWGSSFVVLKSALDSVPVFYILAIRFTGAAILIALFQTPKLKLIDRGYIKAGAVMGLFLFAAYAFQTIGLTYTTPGKNAFLTASYCIIVPFMYWAYMKKRPDRYNIAAAVICIAGIGFISLEGGMSVNIGDVLTLVSGIFYAAHIVATVRLAQGKQVLLVTLLQFVTAAVCCWAAALMFEEMPRFVSAAAIVEIAYLCVICTAVALACQCFGQMHTSPSAAAIILTLESLFGAGISVALGVESLSAGLFTGFVLMFAAVLISETKLSFIRRRKTPEETQK